MLRNYFAWAGGKTPSAPAADLPADLPAPKPATPAPKATPAPAEKAEKPEGRQEK